MRQMMIGVLCCLLFLAPAGLGAGQGKGKKDVSRSDQLRDKLASPKAEVRKDGLNAVQHALHYEFAAEVVALVDDPEVRGEAIYACGRLQRAAQAAIPKLLQALKSDPTPEVRRRAASALGSIGITERGVLDGMIGALRDPVAFVRRDTADAMRSFRDEGRPALPALLAALKDDDKDVRNSAADALAWVARDTPPVLEAVLVLLKSERESDWDVAGRALYWSGPEMRPAVPLLIAGLASPSRAIRSTAAHLVGKAGPDAADAVPALIKALRDESQPVRQGAAWSLSQIGPKATPAVPALLALDDRDAWTRRYVLDALGKAGPDTAAQALPHLVKCLAGNHNADDACRALADLGPAAKKAVPALVQFLTTGREYDCIQAAIALYRIEKHPAAVPALIKIVRTSTGNEAGDAALALANLGPDGEEGIPALIQALAAPKMGHYGFAAALGNFGKAAANAVPALVNALDRAVDPVVRIGLADALWRIERHPRALATFRATLTEQTGKDAYRVRFHTCQHFTELGKSIAVAAPEVVPLLRDPDSMVRREAARALGEMGTTAPEIVEALRAALKDEVWTVRADAAASLGKFGPAARGALPTLRAVRADPLLADVVAAALQRIEGE